MKFQIKSIVAALAIAGVCICSAKPSLAQKTESQQKQATDTYQSPHERNAALVGNFLKINDQTAAFNMLKQIKNGFAEELAVTKRQIQMANQSGDVKTEEKATKFDKELGDIFNTVIQKSRSIGNFDKKAVDMALTKYLTLQH
ncbi:MAG TPA: hypothetical protein VFL76_04765 [Edaphocola sp.]|nr:hypothetical protein [Edaphocola sp.]